jgi:hypothetical protein
MAVTFAQFDTTPAGAVAAIKAAILASTDWSNPAGDRVICTTTRGAAMVVDLADAAASVATLQFGVYRTTGLADKIIRYLRWRVSGGATSDPLHCAVSAGKDHLFITVEGPRAGAPMVRPYLLLEDVAGLRGRLAAIFNMGWNGIGSFGGDVPAQPFSRITIGSGTYIGLPVLRQTNSYCSFGGVGSSDPSGLSPIVAVPYA